MTNKKEFNEVDKSYFVKRFNKLMREKLKRKFVANILVDDNPNFVLSAPPPIKKKDIDPVIPFVPFITP